MGRLTVQFSVIVTATQQWPWKHLRGAQQLLKINKLILLPYLLLIPKGILNKHSTALSAKLSSKDQMLERPL